MRARLFGHLAAPCIVATCTGWLVLILNAVAL